MSRRPILSLLIAGAFAAPHAQAGIDLIARGSLSGSLHDLSGLSGLFENGVAGDLLGGMGSGLAWAGGSTFLALPDRGPNAVPWIGGGAFDNTTSFIARWQTVTLGLTASPSMGLPYTLTPTLAGTTLFHSTDTLSYGGVTPAINGSGKSYFSGRSDNFDAGKDSLNPLNGRLDPEGVRVSNDGKSVFVSDEYGPYVYQFDRATGQRTRTFALPDTFAVKNLSAIGANEIAGNTSGRVANKGMEGLAITPDGKTLVGFEQSPLIQDGGDGGRANRIVSIDIASGAVKQFAYDNQFSGKNYNSSEIVALNDHQFLVLERDGKGLGDGSLAKVKQLYMVDLAGAQDVSALSGEAALLAKAPTKTRFLDIRSALNAAGIADDKIPAKLEGLAFGEDVVIGGVVTHTLYIANDNDFQSRVGELDNPNQWFVFGFTDSDLTRLGASPYVAQAIPEPGTSALTIAGLLGVGLAARRRAKH